MADAPQGTGPDGNGLLSLFSPALITTFTSGYSLDRLRGDIFGGVTAAVIALPLALAFGVASGAGPAAGLYGAIAVGFFAAVFGGTPAQVSGPTGPMTVVMAAVIATHSQNLAEAFTIVMLGGVLQIAFGALRVGKYVSYTPYSVVSGFMTGIGLIIIIIQSLPFLGLPTSTGGVMGTFGDLGALDFSALDIGTPVFALGTLLLIIFWPKRLQAVLPAPLAALLLGTIVAYAALPGLPRIGEVPTGLPSLVIPSLSLDAVPQVVQAAFVLALLGSIDSLLTSLVADSVTRTRHDSDKELVGQGLGNLAAGLLGALPGAGATMRTVVNVRAGGRTPVSGALHALILLGLALGLGPVVSHVPHALLAAILLKVGWDIIDWSYLKRLRRAPRDKVVIMLVTLALTVFVDLIIAVAVGIILASFVSSRWLAEEQLKGIRHTTGGEPLDDLTEDERTLLRGSGGKIAVTILQGAFSFASSRELARRVSPKATGLAVVIYDFANTGYLDTSAAMAVDEVLELAHSNGQRVFLVGLGGTALATLEGLRILDRIPASDRFDDRKRAIETAVALIGDGKDEAADAPAGGLVPNA